MARRKALAAALESARQAAPEPDRVRAALEELLCPKAPDRALLHRYVSRIRVHQGVREGKTKRQQVEICWRFGHTPEH